MTRRHDITWTKKDTKDNDKDKYKDAAFTIHAMFYLIVSLTDLAPNFEAWTVKIFKPLTHWFPRHLIFDIPQYEGGVWVDLWRGCYAWELNCQFPVYLQSDCSIYIWISFHAWHTGDGDDDDVDDKGLFTYFGVSEPHLLPILM